MPNYPNVPNAPGVPPLQRAPGASTSTPAPMTRDSVSPSGGFNAPKWGVFDGNNNTVIIADSVVSVEYKHLWQISDFPVEQGGFASYNKVQIPFDARVVFTKGGTIAQKSAFLSQIEAAAASTNLYNVVTPEMTYLNANIDHIDYRRTAHNGLGLITVEVWLQEVKQTATSSFVNTASPSGADPVNGGQVQANPATASQSKYASQAT